MTDPTKPSWKERLATLLTRPAIRNPILLVAFAALAFILWRSDDPQTILTDAQKLRGAAEPDTFVNQGEYRVFDEQGQLQAVISSPRIEQLEGPGEARMVQPEASLYDADTESRWHLVARQGSFDQSSRIMELDGDVRVTRNVQGGEAILRTEHLRIDNTAGRISTDQPVTLESPGAVTRANSLTGWIDERVLELDNTVEGIYETRP
ncbi:lipopolysaccharide export system protein LptC [Marinobacter daqiaonensis]|uniref:Lipopolysaccharide export system protein LptC n=1 Tax=Marinobacter daqiaonensis TaxID=650891 RepID=A0A1I6HBY4_9GAMM|nr:LPS export ABC transporter periplasmic protein LptC [Marinobacter daqiaonensis]SFR51881.1 lipopolysaccharide export system protein LptC [Marinobacter daqiaonensis]